MVSNYLTRSVIAMISSDVEVTKPILQVSDIRLLKNTVESTMERYRTLLFDGDHIQQGMLAKQMNGIVKVGRLQNGSIDWLDDFICVGIQGRRSLRAKKYERVFFPEQISLHFRRYLPNHEPIKKKEQQ